MLPVTMPHFGSGVALTSWDDGDLPSQQVDCALNPRCSSSNAHIISRTHATAALLARASDRGWIDGPFISAPPFLARHECGRGGLFSGRGVCGFDFPFGLGKIGRASCRERV